MVLVTCTQLERVYTISDLKLQYVHTSCDLKLLMVCVKWNTSMTWSSGRVNKILNSNVSDFRSLISDWKSLTLSEKPKMLVFPSHLQWHEITDVTYNLHRPTAYQHSNYLIKNHKWDMSDLKSLMKWNRYSSSQD